MKFPRKLALLGCIFWASIIASYFITSDWGYVADLAEFFSGAFLFVAVPITALAGISKQGIFSTHWLPRPIVCAFFIFGFAFWHSIIPELDSQRFQQQLPDYAGVVERVRINAAQNEQSGRVTDFGVLGHPPGRAGAVWFDRCGPDNVIVTFMVHSRDGALGPHWGYIYNDCPDRAADASPSGANDPDAHYRHIQGPWYAFYRP
jgi:hypothetical protein